MKYLLSFLKGHTELFVSLHTVLKAKQNRVIKVNIIFVRTAYTEGGSRCIYYYKISKNIHI